MGKPELPVILMSTELSELVGPQSWFIVKVAEVPMEELEKWKRGEATQSFDTFKNCVKKIPCVNDCTERNIRLIQDFFFFAPLAYCYIISGAGVVSGTPHPAV